MLWVKEYIGKRIVFICTFFLMLAPLLTACTDQQNTKPKPSIEEEKQDEQELIDEVEWKLPISVPEGEFYKMAGWLTEQQILYITNLEQTSNLYYYDLLKGESTLLYKTEEPIVTVQISGTKKYILVQTAPSSYEGAITIIDQSGTILLKQSIESVELAFEWNPYNDIEILVSAFNEDWTYQMLLLDIEKNTTTELNLTQPFVKWIGENKLAYLDWGDVSVSLSAPLMSISLDKMEERMMFPEVFQFFTYRDLLMTITVDKEDQTKATYSFLKNETEPIFSFSMPTLSMFSGWLVPFYDYNRKAGKFVTLQPLRSGDADSYLEGFQLVSYDLNQKNTEVILEGLKNAPVHLSPSGKALLYGNHLENIIDLKAKKIYELVKE